MASALFCHIIAIIQFSCKWLIIRTHCYNIIVLTECKLNLWLTLGWNINLKLIVGFSGEFHNATEGPSLWNSWEQRICTEILQESSQVGCKMLPGVQTSRTESHAVCWGG